MSDRRRPVVAVVRRVITVATILGGLVAASTHRHQLIAGLGTLGDLSWWWLAVGVAFEAISLASYSQVQRRLLGARNAPVTAIEMAKISISANALASSLPGGVAWSTAWSWKQLRQRGVGRPLATWSVLAAGALSSFALFMIVVAGAEIAGSHGPVASLRWVGRLLATIPLGACLILVARRARRTTAPDSAFSRTLDRIGAVRLSPGSWTVALTLALANWLLDLACLITCLAAVGAAVPWDGIVIAYALTQIVAALPITPGGLGVVEGGLTALLVAYGVPLPSAVAAVVIYRAVTFWFLVPVGWVLWWRLDDRRLRRPKRLGPQVPVQAHAQVQFGAAGTMTVPFGNIISVANVTDIGGSALDNQIELLSPNQAPFRRVMDTTGGTHENLDVNLEPID
jgi:uncharacterized membrane protein YbhN (UPF0104 family)